MNGNSTAKLCRFVPLVGQFLKIFKQNGNFFPVGQTQALAISNSFVPTASFLV